MKKYIYSFLLLFACLFSGCDNYEPHTEILECEFWNTGISLASAESFVYNDTLYVLFGRSNESSDRRPSDKIYFAPMDNLSDFESVILPIKPRVSAAAVLSDEKLYMGLGFNGKAYNDTSILCDWYCYDFNTKKLNTLAPFPDNSTVHNVVWSDKNYIYAAMGFSTTFERNTYRYSIIEDKWELISDQSPMWLRGGLVGERVGDKIYMGTGYRTEMMNDWWQYDFSSDKWGECKKMPGKGRVFASCQNVGDKLYILGGRYFGGTETMEYFYEDVMMYDTANDIWSVVGVMPDGGTENMISFEYEGDLYWGLGQRKKGSFSNKIYKYTIQ